MRPAEVTRLSGEVLRLRRFEIADAVMTLRWRLSPQGALLDRGAKTAEEQARWIASRGPHEINFIIELLDGDLSANMSETVGMASPIYSTL